MLKKSVKTHKGLTVHTNINTNIPLTEGSTTQDNHLIQYIHIHHL